MCKIKKINYNTPSKSIYIILYICTYHKKTTENKIIIIKYIVYIYKEKKRLKEYKT